MCTETAPKTTGKTCKCGPDRCLVEEKKAQKAFVMPEVQAPNTVSA